MVRRHERRMDVRRERIVGCRQIGLMRSGQRRIVLGGLRRLVLVRPAWIVRDRAQRGMDGRLGLDARGAEHGEYRGRVPEQS